MKNLYLENLLKSEEKPSRGAQAVLMSYQNSKREGYKYLVMNYIVWEVEREEVVNTLRESGIKTFIFSDSSTASMETMVYFIKAGFKVVGTESCSRKNDTIWDKPITGLKIKVTQFK